MWWFIEVALGKDNIIASAFKTLAALEVLLERESPDELTLLDGDHVTRSITRALAHSRGVSCNLVGEARPSRNNGGRHAGLFHLGETLAARLRPAPKPSREHVQLVVFVHSAFWSSIRGDRYLGPVIRALQKRLPSGEVRLVGIGPRTTWQMRHRRRAATTVESAPPPFQQIERYASLRAVWPSLRVWLSRNEMWRELLASPDLRSSMYIRGCDLSPLLVEEMANAIRIHLPWSARAMDEMGAALDILRPRLALTYAEAGAWGRALVIEGRRRRIPVIGVQHGFIGRHWLNYRHEPDEMQPSATNASDRGYPLPDLTLLFDGYAARHLRVMGSMPSSALQVAGSPELDALATGMKAQTKEQLEAARRLAGAGPGQAVVLIVSKFTEIQPVYRALVEAVRSLPSVQAVVKCHPAETRHAYVNEADNTPNLTVLDSNTDLIPLLGLSRLVVTVNSTLAFHAMALGIPTLTLQMPNNLRPFVDGAAMAGLLPDEPIAPMLHKLLYDDALRNALANGADAFLTRYSIRSDGRSVERMTDTILQFLERTDRPE